MKTLRHRMRTMVLASAGFGFLFQGCPVVGPVVGALSECVAPGSLSSDQFDDLNFLAQLGYEENDCGRYVPRDDVLSDLLD